MKDKYTVDQIRERFDNEVDRFSNLETGQTAAMDSVLCLEIITESADRICPGARKLLDIGCGAGNYTLKMLSKNPSLHCTIVDLSSQMLHRAEERIKAAGGKVSEVLHGDIREAELTENSFDIILAGAVLHHLRGDKDWEDVFRKIYKLLRPGGCFMVFDLISHESRILENYFREKYYEYLNSIDGEDYADKIFTDIEKEDSPRPVTFQLNMMNKVGFRITDVLHKNSSYAAFCGIK